MGTKLLWMSDSPTLRTGFATVTQAVLSRLSYLDHYEVACLGWGYQGWPYDHRLIPFDIYPSVPSNLGQDTLERALEEFQPDILVTLGDIWMVEWVTQLSLQGGCALLAYFPIDGAPLYPPWQSFIRSVDIAVTCSVFAKALVERAVADVEIRLIPHGVDTEVFRPLSDRPRPDALAGKFVVGCVARNQPRKNLPLLIRAFSRFCQDKPDAVLYLHSDPNDVGWDLLDLLKRHGVFGRTCITRSVSITTGVSALRLNEIYNLFDIMVLPSAGEGFGLPILESMAAGVPVIATGYSACIELVEGRGELIEVAQYVTAGRHNVDYAIPDIDDLVDKMNLLYAEPDRRRAYSQAGLSFARTQDWSAITREWDALLQHAASTT